MKEAYISIISGGDPFSLQELLGHENMETVKIYMRMNDEMIQGQKRKFSPEITCLHVCPDQRRAGEEASGP